MSTRSRPLGGRYAEWTNGTYKVLKAPSGSDEGRVITAPLPQYQATLVGVAPPAALQPMSAPQQGPSDDAAPPPPSSRGGAAAQAEPRVAKKAVPIRKDPHFDRLLNALDYQRPYVPEQKSETNGDPSAAYAAGPRLLAVGVDTPPLEPKIKLTDSLVGDLVTKVAPASPMAAAESSRVVAPESAPSNMPTVVTRRTAASVDEEPAAGVPRRAQRPVLIGAALCLLFGVVVLTLVLMRLTAPAPSNPPLAAQPPSPAKEDATPTIPPPPVTEESASALVAAPASTPIPSPSSTASTPHPPAALSAQSIGGPGPRSPRSRSGAPGEERATRAPAPPVPPIDPHEKQTLRVEE